MEIIYICMIFNLYMQENIYLTKSEKYKTNFIVWFQMQNIKTYRKYTEEISKETFLCYYFT